MTYQILQAPRVREDEKTKEIIIADTTSENGRCYLRMRFEIIGEINMDLTPEELFAGLKARERFEAKYN